jgi:enoyl-CoA hydratase/carnithine racemase
MDTGTERMIARREGGIGWMIFNNPARRNAVSVDMWRAMPTILNAYVADPEVRVIVLAGAGDQAFVAGADISEFEKQRSGEDAVTAYNALTEQANLTLVDCPKPTVAMIRGFCIGGGLAIALNCDIRIAAEDAQFAIPAAKLGLGYGPSGIRRLMGLVGPSAAKEIFYTAERFGVARAREMGLVNRVVPVEELEPATRKLAGTIAANAPLTIAAVKRSVTELLKDPDKRDLEIGRAHV